MSDREPIDTALLILGAIAAMVAILVVAAFIGAVT